MVLAIRMFKKTLNYSHVSVLNANLIQFTNGHLPQYCLIDMSIALQRFLIVQIVRMCFLPTARIFTYLFNYVYTLIQLRIKQNLT